MTVIISHKDCPDGLASAWALMLRHPGANYHFLAYHDALPDIAVGESVYIVDYARPAQELLTLLDAGIELIWLDHHETGLMEAIKLWASFHPSDRQLKTARNTVTIPAREFEHAFSDYTDEELERFIDRVGLKRFSFTTETLYCDIDLSRSGAVITWEHACPGAEIPAALLYIQDRDLWRWRLPDSEAVSEGLFHLLKEMQANELEGHSLAAAISGNLNLDLLQLQHFDELVGHPRYIELMTETGIPLVQKRREEVAKLCEQRSVGSINGYRAPICPAPTQRSWVGHELCNLYPEANFSVTYRYANQGKPNQDSNVLLVDLRCNGEFRCNSLARKFGGGGHRSAAGFTLYRLPAMQVGDRFQMVSSVSDGMNLIPPVPWEAVWELLPDSIVVGRAPDREDQTIGAHQFENAWLVKRAKKPV